MISNFWHIIKNIEKLFFSSSENSSFEIKYQVNICFQQWQTNDSKIHSRINSMCIADIELQIVDQSSAKSAWNKLKIHCSPKKWTNKWSMMKRVENIIFFFDETIQTLQTQLQKLKEKINDFKIIMNDYFVIKTFNCFNIKFNITFIVFKHETIKDDKFFDLDEIFKIFWNAEYFLTISVNLIKQNDNKVFNDHFNSLKSKDSKEAFTFKCPWCGKSKHKKKRCLAKNAICRFCNKKNHWESICIIKKHQAKKKKKKRKLSITSKTDLISHFNSQIQHQESLLAV